MKLGRTLEYTIRGLIQLAHRGKVRQVSYTSPEGKETVITENDWDWNYRIPLPFEPEEGGVFRAIFPSGHMLTIEFRPKKSKREPKSRKNQPQRCLRPIEPPEEIEQRRIKQEKRRLARAERAAKKQEGLKQGTTPCPISSGRSIREMLEWVKEQEKKRQDNVPSPTADQIA